MSTYTVVAGDTLWGIAARHLGAGDRWPEIAAASRVHHPDLIHPGQVLTIPTDGAHAAAADTLAAETIGPEGAGLVLRLPEVGVRDWLAQLVSFRDGHQVFE